MMRPSTTSVLSRIAPDEPVTTSEEGIRFESRGVVLVIGPAAVGVRAAGRLAKTLSVVACLSGEAPECSPRDNPQLIAGRIASLSGHLGQFTAHVHAAAGETRDFGVFSSNADGRFDLVLDLSPVPLMRMEIKPLGYFAPASDAGAVDAAIEQLLALKGNFRKPRYFKFHADLCAHGAQSVSGCTRCLDVCPTSAISSAGDTVAIDANLCQGCSTCMLVCPTGAITHASPLIGDVLPRIASQRTTQQPADAPTRLLLHQESDPTSNLHNAYDRQALPAIAAVGIETWLAALATGVSQVVIKLPRDLPASTRNALRAQVAHAQAMLPAVGQPAARVAIISGVGDVLPDVEVPACEQIPPIAWPAGKREMLMLALRLVNSSTDSSAHGAVSIALPAGAPLGTVNVDRDACTLCMACTNLCPTQALLPATAGLRLNFVESRCVQCGICAAGCPERAIVTQPRLLIDADAREATRTLNEDEKHACPSCGKGFIGRAMLARSQHVMRASGFLDENAIDGLRLCPACRARAMTG